MDINEIEKGLDSFSIPNDQVMAQLMYKAISANAMLEVMLKNQAVIMNKLAPEKSPDDYLTSYMADVKEASREIFLNLLKNHGT